MIKQVWDGENTPKKMSSATVDVNGKTVSFAGRCRDLLDDAERVFGVDHSIKGAVRQSKRVIHQKFYTHTDYTHGNLKIPLPTTAFKVESGFDSPTYLDAEGKTKHWGMNGIKEHYHYYCHYEMPMNEVAARRIPCSCQALSLIHI